VRLQGTMPAIKFCGTTRYTFDGSPRALRKQCDFLTPANRARELRGVIADARLPGKRRALVLTLNQPDPLREDGVSIEVLPAWRWMA
jgi:hypothetical protein